MVIVANLNKYLEKIRFFCVSLHVEMQEAWTLQQQARKQTNKQTNKQTSKQHQSEKPDQDLRPLG